jgi:Ca2+-binding EF-hand superfamily protein
MTGAISAAALCAGPLAAEDEADLFSKLDANKDGFVTPDEVNDDQKAIYQRLLRNGDIDDDKKLSKGEFDAGLKPADAPRQPLGVGDRVRPGGGQFDPKQRFEQLDADKDGKLSKDEIPERMRSMFARFDRDTDGQVTLAEFERGSGPPSPQQVEANFDRFDRNDDGKLTLEELPEPIREGFKRMLERTGGESLTKEQYLRAMQTFAQMAGRRPDSPRPSDRPDARPEGRPGEPRPGFRGPGGMPLVRALDKDGDGEISSSEIEAAAAGLKTLDKNDDGKLTRDEIFPGMPDGPPIDRSGFREAAAAFHERLMKADENKDGKLSKEELASASGVGERLREGEGFDRIDADGDGMLDEAELRRMVERFRGGDDRRGPPDDRDRPRPDGKRRSRPDAN